MFPASHLRFSGPLLAFCLLSLLPACPPSSTAPQDAAAEPAKAGGACARIGQTCEFAPGKLGTCVQKDDCQGPGPCFVCQSQH
jgi:hypothetical protein